MYTYVTDGVQETPEPSNLYKNHWWSTDKCRNCFENYPHNIPIKHFRREVCLGSEKNQEVLKSMYQHCNDLSNLHTESREASDEWLNEEVLENIYLKTVYISILCTQNVFLF